jgi:UDP-N-acetylmuramyl pentapeptide phosphotransferase/UDP-N-acetylglucosamine-1-phosphate transferase
MDGMDGFAGGMAVIGFSTMAIIGYLSGAVGFGIFCALIASAAAGFLIWNFPPARIFMGDLGSTTIGYLMAVMSIYGVTEKIFPWWCPVIIFAPFWLDASLTLLKRIIAGQRFWEAHREHYYQRLVLANYTHRQVVLWEYALMFLSSGSVVFGYPYGILLEGALVPITWLFIYMSLVVCLECHLRSLST